VGYPVGLISQTSQIQLLAPLLNGKERHVKVGLKVLTSLELLTKSLINRKLIIS
jgi:hypothetical protein